MWRRLANLNEQRKSPPHYASYGIGPHGRGCITREEKLLERGHIANNKHIRFDSVGPAPGPSFVIHPEDYLSVACCHNPHIWLDLAHSVRNSRMDTGRTGYPGVVLLPNFASDS